MCRAINAIISTLHTPYEYSHVHAKPDPKLFHGLKGKAIYPGLQRFSFHSNIIPICLVRDSLLYLHLVMGTPWALLFIDRAKSKRQLVGCYMSMQKSELYEQGRTAVCTFSRKR